MPFNRQTGLVEHDVARARTFALISHGSQLWGELPYVYHLDAVHLVYISVAHDLEGRTACFLHDVVEDTDTTLESVEEEFGPDVRRIVDFCTALPGKNRKEKVLATNSRTAKSDDFHAMLVKLSDRIVNIERSIHLKTSHFEMYRSEQPAFKEAIYRDSSPNTLLQKRLDSLFKI